MMARYSRSTTLAACCLVSALALGACSDNEEAYRQAVQELADAQAQRDEARQELASRQEELAQTRSQLQRAQADVEDARNAVAEARQEVMATADEVVLFRVIQGKMLEDATLDSAAVAVDVNRKTVTLRGLASEQQAAHAEALASTQPGVESVNNLIVIRPEDGQDKQERAAQQ